MNDVVTWIALFAAVTAVLGLLRFWQSYSDRLAKSEAETKAAREELTEAKSDISNISTQIAAVNASFALYREQTAKEAREFITRDVLRELEARVSNTAHENAERISREITGLAKRLDDVLVAWAAKATPRVR